MSRFERNAAFTSLGSIKALIMQASLEQMPKFEVVWSLRIKVQFELLHACSLGFLVDFIQYLVNNKWLEGL